MQLRSRSARATTPYAFAPVRLLLIQRQLHSGCMRAAGVPGLAPALIRARIHACQPHTQCQQVRVCTTRGAGSGGPQPSSSAAASFAATTTTTTTTTTSSSATDMDIPVDMPAPPRPSSYVPPAERDPTDPSLAFLRHEDPVHTRHAMAVAGERRRQEGTLPLAPGQKVAPQHESRTRPPRAFADADAARVQSSSVHAGMSLLGDAASSAIGSGTYYADTGALPARDGDDGDSERGRAMGARSRLHILKGSARAERPGEAEEMLTAGESAKAGGYHAQDTMFGAKHHYANLEDVVGEDGGLPKSPPPMFRNRPGSSSPDSLDEAGDSREAKVAPKIPLAKQIERDIRKLEYYSGSPQYPELLRQFREKYGKEKGAVDEAERELQQRYSSTEVAQGLDSQPIDFHRTSSMLQAQLSSGPYGYSPVTIMQQHGVMRFQGYAFPPSTELGRLQGVDDLKALQDARREKGVVGSVRKSFNALMGRKDTKEAYLATEDGRKRDTHIVYRTLKLDAVQRRQMRFMLTDFDYKDRNTAFHVMMSYPYTDWIHVFFMVLVGWSLYQLQVRFGAYEFYDEYLGLDLRQVPSVKKPFLGAITVVVMLFFMFQPLLVASIATTRAYRIVTRRPIGPP